MSDLKIINSATEDEKILIRHVLDLASQSFSSGRQRSSCFLDERQCALCEHALRSSGFNDYELTGGYENAVRRVIVFSGYGAKSVFTPVVFNYRDKDKLTHRDFLGALMSLNIKREMIGDILVNEKRAVVFVMNTVLPLVKDMTKVSRCSVTISYDFSADDIPEQEFEVIKATVSSLRLDSCLSAAIRQSREKTQELIRSKGVVLNHVETYNPSSRVEAGDVFSVRGLGKFVIGELGGLSKKDRIFITINKYK